MQFLPAMGIGEYRIDRALGDGRFDAHHAIVERRVTIKVAADAAPLVREARALERLRHPRVPRVYDVEPAWIAIERVEGAPITASDALAAVRDVAAILDHAHDRGVVHGALAAGVVAWVDGEAWIVDWSSARLDDSAAARADDILALGMLARALVGGLASGPFVALVARMVDRDPARRPCAADVRLALAGGAPSDDEPPIEDIVLDDREPGLGPASSTAEGSAVDDRALADSDTKLRWTPAFGVGAPEEFACPERSSDASSRPHDRRPDRYRAR